MEKAFTWTRCCGPSALARLGLEWGSLHARFPRLCYVAIVGYLPPHENVPGHDLTYQAAYGMLTPPHLPRVLVADMAGAHELYRFGEYSQAESLFHRVAENQKNPASVAEEARYYEAECARRQGSYPKAADLYTKLLSTFPAGMYREPAVQHMFEIANYWLDETRQEMEEYREKKEGKRWVVMPHFINWEKQKPFLDIEGRALEKLEQVVVVELREKKTRHPKTAD